MRYHADPMGAEGDDFLKIDKVYASWRVELNLAYVGMKAMTVMELKLTNKISFRLCFPGVTQ